MCLTIRIQALIRPTDVLGAFAALRKGTNRFVMTVWPSASTGRFFIKFLCCDRTRFHYKLTKIAATLHEDLYTLYLVELFSEIENFPTKVVEKIKIQILHSTRFFPENIDVYEKIWKNMANPDRST